MNQKQKFISLVLLSSLFFTSTQIVRANDEKVTGPEERIIISDIDDTIRPLHARHEGDILDNVKLFFRRTPFSGMSELYQEAAANGVKVYYVTNATHRIERWLKHILTKNRFPNDGLIARSGKYKTALDFKTNAIESIMKKHPNAKVILIGDNGQHDPEVFARVKQGPLGSRVEKLIIHKLYRESHFESPEQENYLTAADLALRLNEASWVRADQVQKVVDIVARDLESERASISGRAFPHFGTILNTDVATLFDDHIVDNLGLVRESLEERADNPTAHKLGLLNRACGFVLGKILDKISR